MRCSPKLCIGLILVGIGGAALLTASGYVKAASLIAFLPLLACPLMCVFMMMFGHKCDYKSCDKKSSSRTNVPK
ncbi:DUF2933 domain-containing protein [Candidatus Peregrinibacteria bacterium]|nr:DUF2933 domain-containing protein [Candidatus Peregrinibacteria bacterium]